MKKLTLSEISKPLGGKYNFDASFDSVCLDTRQITPGCLFVCIKGERFDAHDFAAQAVENGAAALLVHRSVDLNVPCLIVDDTTEALLELAAYYRSKFDIPVVGLTGSVGKTTTKDFTYLVVNSKYNAVKTQGNLNNNIGLPRTIFSFDEDTTAAVVEMGMNHFGEISRLSKAARPTVGVITNIGVSHIENLGSRDGILKAKLEIADGLKKGALLILNADDDKLCTVKNDDFNIMFYGVKGGDFVAKNIMESAGKTSFVIDYFSKKQKIVIPTIGIHNVYNALAAFAVGFALGVDPQEAADALANYEPSGMRQRFVKKGGISCIEDCYNASPDSMRAALRTLCDTPGNKKIAVLGDMLELGDYAPEAHRFVGLTAAQNKVDYLLAFGENARYYVSEAEKNGCKNAFLFSEKQALSDMLLKIAQHGDVVIFKGSRGMKLEEIINNVYKVWEN